MEYETLLWLKGLTPSVQRARERPLLSPENTCWQACLGTSGMSMVLETWLVISATNFALLVKRLKA